MRIILNDYSDDSTGPLEVYDDQRTSDGSDLLVVERMDEAAVIFESFDEFAEFIKASKLVAPSWWAELDE